MLKYFLVAIGAALGGTLRYWVGGVTQKLLPFGFPYGTLVVNVLGSFILGFLIYYFDARQMLSPGVRVMLAVGFCGGFTTFSSFSFETMNLFRDSEYFLGLLNVGLNIFLTLLAVFLAFYLAKTLNAG